MAVLIDNADDIAAGLPGSPAPGDNRNALAMAGLGNQIVIDGVDSYNSFYARITSRIGIESNQNELSLGGAEDAVNQLENLREGFVGVSLEEEMISLIQYQRGFESSAKFLSTVDELMESLINLKR
jgi:flagellar hook-associated protein 1 FlgK